MQQPNAIIERLSASSPTPDKNLAPSPAPGKYHEVKTPDMLEGGALRPGGVPDMYSRKNIGMLAQYGGIGLVYGSLYGVLYPLLNNYLRMTGTESASASALLLLPWTWKMFFGILSDCYPIFGFRRRPYIIIGWIVTFVACFLMAVIPLGDPKYGDPALVSIPETQLTPDQIATINYDAPGSGVKYILLLVLANLGCVVVSTVSDGLLVELGQREPENIRGSLQTMTYVSQGIFQVFSTAMIGFGLNSADYGGGFEHSMGFNAVMGVSAFFALAIIPISWFCITEEKAERQSLRKYLDVLYDLIQQRVVYQILAFRFFRNLFSYFSVTAAYPIQSLWAHVTPVNEKTSSVIGLIVSSATMYATKKYGLAWSWHTMIIITQILVIIIDSIPTFFTIWDVYRAQWFWLGGPLLENLPSSVGLIISTFAVMEIIEVGNEASVYGLITTVSTLASPFSTVLSKNVCANFDIDYASLQIDDHHVRMEVTWAYIIAYVFKLFSLVFVVLLPRQKAETQELKRSGGKSKLMGNITIFYLIFTFCWTLMTNLMSFSSSTSCLKIAGGSGC